MEYKFIRLGLDRYRKEATLVLAREEKRNAFTPTMVNEIAHAINQINDDPNVNLVIMKAEGPVFCAGMDLKTFNDSTLDTLNPNIVNKDLSLGDVIRGLIKPSIAIIEGDVIAGAFLLVLGCSYVYAAPNVRFKLPELDLGLFPFQVMASLLRIVPEKKVLQLCLETDYFDVKRAIELGIVDGLLDTEKVDERINYLRNVEVEALTAGIKSLHELSDMNSSLQYDFLKSRLNQLRMNKSNKSR
ncbi:enoyl-CoA hydratase/isomerase family protein [Sphingobacterium shayense]|uniref:enoyl-CoA hydratase/isomerase family protein n=1 Tax=Sphingobacterium shayense TaxID=626343 RepID=UPI0015518D50|nr:enoyl-CoA hydratase/isomerase family protein [Sphingobacterium shayense]NQD70515.1 enoyl-CoA hydratase/isomerase family protein [Sphingobacterium shayense]